MCVLWYRSDIDVKVDTYDCRLGVNVGYLRCELGEESSGTDSRLRFLDTCLQLCIYLCVCVYVYMYANVFANKNNNVERFLQNLVLLIIPLTS